MPSADEFEVAFRESNYTNSNSKQKNIVRYILRKFSEHYKYRYSCDYDELTIEHYYPQSKIGNVWTEELVGSLGNLFYLEEIENGKLDAKSPEEKKKLLKKANAALPKFIDKASKWSPELIRSHTDDMAKVAQTKIWKI